jgi:hypothetical protein
MGFFDTKKTTFDPMSMYTPEQLKSVQALMSLASTGSGGGITLGQGYGGDLGYYQQSPEEMQSLQGLMGLLSGGDMTGARDVYSRMANNKFNPDDPSSGYAAFSRALAKSGAESADVLNREAAMTGSRFGTGIQKQKGELAGDLANQRGMFLANLFNQGENRALQGAGGLQSLAGQEQRIYGQIQQQAEIQRLLKDQQAKEQYNEFKRSRSEELSRIGLMQDQWSDPMGSITKKGPSTFMSMLGETNPFVGSYNTHKYGYTTNQTSMADGMKLLMSLFGGAGGMGGGGGSTGGSTGIGGGSYSGRSFGGYSSGL